LEIAKAKSNVRTKFNLVILGITFFKKLKAFK